MTFEEPKTSTADAPALLLVDDEANILSALRRLFRPQGYRIFTAESGPLGLEVLEREAIDLVISDMRMPDMSGAQFLAQVRTKWPDTIRILLTGYADMNSTIEAINAGEIYRYLSKPWDANEVLLIVREALERKSLELEKRRLEELTHRQNEELKTLNASLEEKVEQRTQALSEALAERADALERLKKTFINSIRVFSGLVELREGSMAGHSRRVAEYGRAVAQHLGLDESEIQDVMFAGLLHDIGKIGLPDGLLKKPYHALTAEDHEKLGKHPIIGQTVLMSLEQLSEATRLIRWHHERFDGLGYPDGLSGADIPVGARILALVNDYDTLQNASSLASKPMNATCAQEFLRQNKGTRYDPQIVTIFLEILGIAAKQPEHRELALRVSQLKEGMVLTRNFEAEDGALLLSKDYVLTDRIIEQIHNYAQLLKKPLMFYVRG